MRNSCKLKTLKRYIFSSASGIQHAGYGLKLPCNRTFKLKTAITSAARDEYGNGGASSSGRLEYIWLPLEDDSAVPIGLYRSGKFLAVHSDHLNTPRLITDDANKAVWQWPYSAFGDNAPTGILKATAHPASAYTQDPMTNARLQATSPGIAYNLRFPGQYFDVETGLYQNYMCGCM